MQPPSNIFAMELRNFLSSQAHENYRSNLHATSGITIVTKRKSVKIYSLVESYKLWLKKSLVLANS